jgi:hypothetical protein
MHHRDLDGDEADRVAVGRGLRDRAVADDAVAAGAVDDVDRLPSSFSRYAPKKRATASVPPPAPHGTISVIGRSGYAAPAASATIDNTSATSARESVFIVPPGRPRCGAAMERSVRGFAADVSRKRGQSRFRPVCAKAQSGAKTTLTPFFLHAPS